MQDEIEITFPVHAAMSVGFKISRAEWEAMDSDAKIALIDTKGDESAIFLANDVLQFGGGFISAEIIGPSRDEIQLADVDVYDPGKNEYSKATTPDMDA